MDTARNVLEGLLALVLLGPGGSKLARARPVVANFARMGSGWGCCRSSARSS